MLSRISSGGREDKIAFFMTKTMPKNKYVWTINLFLVLATLIAFGQVGNHGFVNLDDNVYITENPHIQNGITVQGLRWAFTTGHASNWHPLTWMSHMLDVQLFGLKPQWHHLTNLLFHIFNVLLLFFVLNKMTKALWQSAFVAALFALHPLHVESVAWVAERKDVLSTFFWMLTLIAYGYYAGNPRLKSYLVVMAIFALGLMAKPMLVTLPFVLLLLDYWPLERFGKRELANAVRKEVSSPVSARKKKGKTGKQTRKVTVEIEKPATREFQWALLRPLVLEKIPLFVLMALSCAATYIAQAQGGAVASIEVFALHIRIANAFVSYLIYIIKTICPYNLAVYYPHPASLPLWQVLGAVLFLVAITSTVIWASKRFPYLPVGWLWFSGTLVPVIGIVQVGGQALADRYTYIPSIGLFIMAAWGIPEIFKKRRYAKEVLAASSALYLLWLFFLTLTQAGYWRDSITLYDHTLNITENNSLIYNNRAKVFQDLGNYTRAIADYDRAIQINSNDARAFNNRGNAWSSLGNHARAIEDFDRALAINPLHAGAYNNRGLVYNVLGNYTRAIQDFDKAIDIDHKSAQFFNNRGFGYAVLGKNSRAFEDFNMAIEIDPHYAEAHYNLGIFYQNSGKYRHAIDYYDKAIENNTAYKVDVFCNRGTAYGSLGDQKKAIEDYGRAIDIDPKYANAYFKRGVAYGELGNQLRAVQDFDKAIEINPGYASAYYYRGRMHASLGNHKRELEDLKTAARYGYEDATNYLKNQGIDY